MALDMWPQRSELKALVKAYRTEHDISRKNMADRLGIAESQLHNLMYDKRVRPSLDFVQRAAELFNVSITALIDDPGSTPIPGTEARWSEVSERDRLMAAAMFSDLTADNLSESEKDEIFRAYKEAKERILRLRKTYKQ